ncbi:hypothetical protein T265_03475 [Opisthorchis viverrini]|uniref:Uncharacterized protein n=1 Tax=Opisthorchis viverrini TaxID=6198 RepID=A0A074ZRE5_OPIVI|nr:hypothetical protein T265_03475 [Opisthorchis viverrini]KER29993.1 hypothetical protein T265_03475 [Opisthorchis viverrini]
MITSYFSKHGLLSIEIKNKTPCAESFVSLILASPVVRFRCPAATSLEGGTRTEILPGYPSLDRGSREAEVFSSPTVVRFRCPAATSLEGGTRTEILPGYPSLDRGSREAEVGFEPRTFRRLEREFADRKVRGSNEPSATRLPLSRLGQPDSIPALVLPSGGMAARHRKGATAERPGDNQLDFRRHLLKLNP